MRTHYLYLSTFACINCNGLLATGFVATRETENQRETIFRQIGPGCLSCGTQYDSLPPSRAVRRIVPFEWGSTDSADKKRTLTSLEDSVAERCVQKRTVDVHSASVACNQSKFPESVHEVAGAETCSADHLGPATPG